MKQIKPDFKKLGPRFGKDMKLVAGTISGFDQEQIAVIEKNGEIEIVVNNMPTTITVDDVLISSQDIEGWLVANANGVTVALDITITPELKNEGIARELVNRIQNIRKDSGFEVTDKVAIKIKKEDALELAVSQNIEYIKQETLTEVLQFEDEISNGTEIAFDEIATQLEIKKH